MTYEWDLESDGSADATGPSVRHTYAAGAHTATLTVRDARGLEASDTVEVLAGESPPTASLLAPAAGETLSLRPADRAQGRGHGRAGRHAGRCGAALADHHPSRRAHASDRGRPQRSREHLHPAGRPRRRLLARVPPHCARLRRPRGHRGREAAAGDGRPASGELPARGGAQLWRARRDGPALLRPAAIGFHTDRVGARGACERRPALPVRSLVGRWRAAARIVIPDTDLSLTAVYAPVPDAAPPWTDISPRPRRPAFPAPPARAAVPRITLDAAAAGPASRRLRGRVVGRVRPAPRRPRAAVAAHSQGLPLVAAASWGG